MSQRARPIALLVAYDGSGLNGWQLQPAGTPTVQGLLEGALTRVHGLAGGERVAIVGAGRTDAGVHALGQVASYHPPTPREPRALFLALRGLLPESVRVRAVREAPAGFHAIRSARFKTYRYRVVTRPLVLPFEAPWCWPLHATLELGAMRRAAATLVGVHDFAAFQSAGSPSKTTTRHLRRLALEADEQGSLLIEAEADGFLYRMVRNIVGLLVEIGRGRRPPEEAARVLASGRRAEGGLTAPARGLCLARVDYGEALSFEEGHGAPRR